MGKARKGKVNKTNSPSKESKSSVSSSASKGKDKKEAEVTSAPETDVVSKPPTTTVVINPDSPASRKLVVSSKDGTKGKPEGIPTKSESPPEALFPKKSDMPTLVVVSVPEPVRIPPPPIVTVSPSKSTDRTTPKKRVLKYARPDQKPKPTTTPTSTTPEKTAKTSRSRPSQPGKVLAPLPPPNAPPPPLVTITRQAPAPLPPATSPAQPQLPPPPVVTVVRKPPPKPKPCITEVALSSIINSVASEGIIVHQQQKQAESDVVKSIDEVVNNMKKEVIVKKKKKIFVTKTAPPEIKITKVGHAVVIKNKEKEKFSIYKLYKDMKESDVISDRWCIPEPMWDPHTNREVLLCYELDVLLDGSVRMKRCIKILENFELIVLLDGSDKTHLFKEKHPVITSTQEMLDLIRRVTMVKVCSGIKDCDRSEFDSIASKVRERGGSWFSTECNVEVERGCLGNICKRCTSLRNSLRRKMRRQFGLESTNVTPTPTPNRNLLLNSLKPVSRTVGEALYINLQHMSGSNRSVEEMMVTPPPRSPNQVYHPELKIYMNSELKQRLDEVAANPPPPLTKIEHIVEFDPRTLTRSVKRVHTPVVPASFRNIISTGRSSSGTKRFKSEGHNQSFVMDGNGELTLVQTPNGETIQLPEGFILADNSQQFGDNIVVQKVEQTHDGQFIVGDDNNIIVGNNFTMEDGEEYEVIGEAASGEGDSIQILPFTANSDIEVIEVDENMIELVDEHSQPEIEPVDANSDIFKFLQAHAQSRF